MTQREAFAARSGDVLADSSEGGGGKATVGDKVRRLAWERLVGNRPVITRWQEVSGINLRTRKRAAQPRPHKHS